MASCIQKNGLWVADGCVFSQIKYRDFVKPNGETRISSTGILICCNDGVRIVSKLRNRGCHSFDGSKLVGPSFKNIYGAERVVETNGIDRKVVADSTYIKNSIINPNDDVVKGYPKGIMQSYKTVLKDDEIRQIIEYFKITK